MADVFGVQGDGAMETGPGALHRQTRCGLVRVKL